MRAKAGLVVLVLSIGGCGGPVEPPEVDAGTDAPTAPPIDAAADAPSMAGDAGSDDAGPGVGGADAGPITVGEVVRTGEGDGGGEASTVLVIFRGIPYAEPPVGALRWRPPVPHGSWATTLDTTTFGSQCAQPPRMGPVGS